MNQKTIFIVLIAALLIIGGGFSLVAVNQKDTQNETLQTPTQENQPDETTTANSEAANVPEGNGVVNIETDVTLEVEAGSYYFKPNKITVKKGQTVTIKLVSKNMRHDFVIDKFNFEVEADPGETTEGNFTANDAGSFTFYCSVGDHRQRGQVGTLVVEE